MLSLFHHPQLRPRHYAGGVVVISFIILFYGSALSSIFTLGDELQWRAWFTDDYLQHLILSVLGKPYFLPFYLFSLVYFSLGHYFISHFWEKVVVEINVANFCLTCFSGNFWFDRYLWFKRLVSLAC